MFRSFRSQTCALCIALAAPATFTACGKGADTAETSWDNLRRESSKSEDHEEVASWLVAELLRPGGSPTQTKKARKRLDEIGAEGVLPSLARGLDSFGHGKSKEAAEEFFAALISAQ